MSDRNEILRQYYSEDELREYKELRRSLRENPITDDMNQIQTAYMSVALPAFIFVMVSLVQWFSIIDNLTGVEFVQNQPSLMDLALMPYVIWPLAIVLVVVMERVVYKERGLRIYKQQLVQQYRNRAVILVMVVLAAIHLGTVIAYSGI